MYVDCDAALARISPSLLAAESSGEDDRVEGVSRETTDLIDIMPSVED